MHSNLKKRKLALQILKGQNIKQHSNIFFKMLKIFKFNEIITQISDKSD